MNIQEAYDYIQKAHNENHRHVTKGIGLNEMLDLEILKNAGGELIELTDATSAKGYRSTGKGCPAERAVLEELSDTMSCLFHFAIEHEYSLDEVAEEMVRKIKLRFAPSPGGK